MSPASAGERGVYLTWLGTQGYSVVHGLPGLRWAALMPLTYGRAALVAGRIGDLYGFDDRWDYEAFEPAFAALLAWDGSGEPAGWIRHPGSGRRVSRSPDERDEAGNRVGAVGVMYHRW